MKTYLKLAWRNLWRNRTRTLITTAAVFFGVLLSAFMSSMQEGSYDHYIDTIVNYFSGYIQVHKKGYWDEKTINNSFSMGQEDLNAVRNTQNVTFTTPRLESFALASHGDITKGAMVIGVDPLKEDSITEISGKLIDGEFLSDGDDGAIIAEDLANYLKLGVADTLVLLSQGYHGATAAGLFRIKGIISHPSPELNRLLVYLDLQRSREFYSAHGMNTSLVVMIEDNKYLNAVADSLEAKLDRDKFEVMTWEEMEPVLLQQIESDRASGRIMKAILYVVIGFGILGTVMMMMAERRKEFGVIMAVGMQKYRLSVVIFLETLMVGMLGVVAGIIASLPLNYYFYLNPIPLTGKAAEMINDMGFDPIMKFSMDPVVFYNQALTIFLITIVIVIYPLVTIFRTKVIEALRA